MSALGTICILPAAAQSPPSGAADPKATEQWEPVPPVVSPGATLGSPPSDAIILFDGRNLDQWVATNDHSPARWKVGDGVMTVDKAYGNIETKRLFRNYQLHLEWRIPKDIAGEGQMRGNSGLFLASTGPGDSGYEIQILDSWKNQTYVNGQAASIYKQAPPLANAMRAPGEWQSYDVVWTAPTFDTDGTLNSPAYVTLFHNGVLVQNHFRLSGETVYIGRPAYRPHQRAAIKLQAHNDPSAPISFRNIWIRELDQGQVSAQQAAFAQQAVPSQVVPLKQFSIDRRFESVSGDYTKSGALYVIRIHAEPGYVVMPHTHPEDENIVVVKGSWAVGTGDHFDRHALESMEVGSYALVPKKMAHFAFSKTDTVVQVHGMGPFTTHWVVPIYELTDKGVLFETSAAEPGRPTPTSPPGCFVLKLGTRVRGSYGEGVVIGARCTPGELTQYRIEKPDRDRFWAQQDELTGQ